MSANKRACLCTICICGRHKCPHNPRGKAHPTEPCVLSEYTREYKPHDHYGKLKDCRPEPKANTSQGPMEDKTTHRVDYIKHPLDKPFVHKADPYQKPDGDMNHSTNYQQHYTRKPLEPVKPIRREEQKRVPARFEGEPTYKVDYKKWEIPPYVKMGSDYIYRAPEDAFAGNTNYQTDYISHGNVPRQQMLRPNQDPTLSDQPFEDGTDYRSSYVQHELPKKEVKEKTVWEPNTAVLDDVTNYRKDYVPRELTKTLSFKPSNKAVESESKFDGSTTHRADYQTPPLDKPWVREREAYKKPDGTMDAMTTSQSDYTRKSGERSQAIRPTEAKKVSASFDSTSQYTTDYISRAPGERVLATKRERYEPPEARFEGEPTYRRDYHSHDGATMTRSLKPVDLGYSSGQPLDDDTEYKKEYSFKLLPPCPSDAIMAGKADTGYTFREQDELGHKWYEIATRA